MAVPPSPQGLIARLARAFPRQPIDKETFAVYLDELEDIPPVLLAECVQDAIRTSEWFPTVRALRERAAERALALPREAAALAQIEARMRWARGGGDGDAPPVHPLVKEALERVGGYHSFRAADDASVIRGQFGRLYRELREQAIAEAQAGTAVQLSARHQPKEIA